VCMDKTPDDAVRTSLQTHDKRDNCMLPDPREGGDAGTHRQAQCCLSPVGNRHRCQSLLQHATQCCGHPPGLPPRLVDRRNARRHPAHHAYLAPRCNLCSEAATGPVTHIKSQGAQAAAQRITAPTRDSSPQPQCTCKDGSGHCRGQTMRSRIGSPCGNGNTPPQPKLQITTMQLNRAECFNCLFFGKHTGPRFSLSTTEKSTNQRLTSPS
jgi:hypothetical protein